MDDTRTGRAQQGVESVAWARFTGRRSPPPLREAVLGQITGRGVLVTGAGGFIGSGLSRALAAMHPAHLILLDRAEAGLAELQAEFNRQHPTLPVEYRLGDVADAGDVAATLLAGSVQVVFHAAACKHVPLLESNPLAAAETNILGTQCVLAAAQRAGVEQVVLLSTDKAVDPASVLGATKRIAELLALCEPQNRTQNRTQTKVLRLGNVLGSTGSVGPLFQRQLALGEPVTLTDARAVRFFLTLEEAVGHLLNMLSVPFSPVLCVPEMGEQRRVEELARFLEAGGDDAAALTNFEVLGLRAGDKLVEALHTAEERMVPSLLPGLHCVQGPLPSWPEVTQGVEAVRDALCQRSPEDLFRAMQALVPAFQPSAVAQAQRQVLTGGREPR